MQEGEDEPKPQQEASKQQRVYIHSEAKKYTEEQIRDTKCSKYEAELTGLNNGFSKSGYLKDLGKVHIKFGRLKQKHKDVSHLYEVVITDKSGPRKGQRYVTSLTFTRKVTHEQKCRASGAYVIRTTHLDWSVEQVARMYWRLTEIESAFHAMKSDLGLHPLYHRKKDRIESHMFLTILAYPVSHLIRFQLKQAGHHHSWDTIPNGTQPDAAGHHKPAQK